MKTAIKYNRTGLATGIALVIALFMSAAPSYAGRNLDRDGDRNLNPPKANVHSRDDKLGGPRVLPLDSKPFGQSYPEWVADFSRWFYSIPWNKNPLIPGNLNCTTPQHGKVWFVLTGSEVASCEVPEGKAIFVTFGGYTDTYPCPDPNFKPAQGQTLEEFLTSDAKYYVDSWGSQAWHELAIDGVTVVDNGADQRVTSKLFTLIGDLSLNDPNPNPDLNHVLDSCITGKPQKAVADGYWGMIVGLTPGKHKLEFLQEGKVTGTINLKVIHD